MLQLFVDELVEYRQNFRPNHDFVRPKCLDFWLGEGLGFVVFSAVCYRSKRFTRWSNYFQVVHGVQKLHFLNESLVVSEVKGSLV